MKKTVKKAPAKNGALRGVYSAYVFKDKDPVIDELRKMVEDVNGSVDGSVLSAIQKDGGPSTSCMRAWFFGKTRRPQNPTVEAAGRALGFKRQWVKLK